MTEEAPPLVVGEAQLRAVLDAIPARVALLDRDRRCRYANREFAEFLGYTPDTVIGKTVAELMGGRAYAILAEQGERALAGETVRWSGWIPYLNRSKPRFVQRLYLPYRGPDGAVEGYFVFARDLTELMEAQQSVLATGAEMRRRDALSSAIIASALDAVIVMDEDGLVVEFNPAAERTFGYPREAAIGRLAGELIVPPAMRERHAAGMRRYLETGKGTVLGRRIEVEAMRSDGSTFPCELAITEVRLPERRLFTAHLRDLTEQRAAAAEIEAQRTKLHQVEKMSAMGSLLAGVAHELNNPLAILLAQAALLRETAATPDLLRRAERIHAAAERSGRIVKSFLAMARQEAPRREPVQVAAVVQAAVELTAYGARSAGIAVEVTHDALLPPVEGDRDLLSQVVANLLVNAQQVLQDRSGPRHVAVRTRRAGEGVVVEVADSGPGVPAEIAGRIFEPYFTTKPSGAGTGIGLAICRNVVTSHGGRIELEDAPGGGALFRVWLPATSAPAAEAVARPEGRAGAASILVVDDEADVAASLAEILEAAGHRVTIRDGGEAALGAARGAHFDAVFTDLRMPGMDGAALRRALLAEQPRLGARTVLVTGDTVIGAVAARAGPGPGGAIVLKKPFTPSEVRAALVRALAAGDPPPT
ncbi:PAS domain S-box protein [Roseomonas sp. CCTCC AB2023176]|uniref:hybrid sensor histidine kinase/response regulator n=1 Tax=Roseomonas sp. CCTCC AB2023176 TaxID=3342640 RepID=UPI0035D75B37